MKRVMVTGCGGYAAIGFVRCLKESPERIFLIGTDCDEKYINFGETDKNILIPPANSDNYIDVINRLVEKYHIDFIHAQPPAEILYLSKNRGEIDATLFLPRHQTIQICDDKFVSNEIWRRKGIPTAKSIFIKKEDDLTEVFNEIQKPIWLRANKGAGAKGCFLVNNIKEAKMWIDFNNGWGNFMASEYLPGKNYGCDLLFNEGELICSQAKLRLQYVLHKANPLGITGTTGFLKCVNEVKVNIEAEKAIYSIDPTPHGVFSVDFRENKNNILCVTEINAGRFLSSSLHLFHKSKLLLPYWYVKLAYNEKIPEVKKYNPLPDGLVLIRQVDAEPKVLMWNELEKLRKIRDDNGYAEL